ncbi:MAG: 6-phosphogluconolactonase [Clostridium sp.]|nr:6-phosphogluconolactonase [Clostridium sp.]
MNRRIPASSDKAEQAMQTEQYVSGQEVLDKLTAHLEEMIGNHPESRPFHLALSGGHTAAQMFSLWNEKYADRLPWKRIRFYWVDERCVPPSHPDSNYGKAKQLLLDPMGIPNEHVFRIRGEEIPETEALRYSKRVGQLLPKKNGLPVFDCIILGTGADGHTASLFPGDTRGLNSTQPYVTAIHPQTGQRRISMSGTTLLNHSPILLPVIGSGKEDIVEKILNGTKIQSSLPTVYILTHAKDARFYYGQ